MQKAFLVAIICSLTLGSFAGNGHHKKVSKNCTKPCTSKCGTTQCGPNCTRTTCTMK